jgi:hypothetical protein
MIDELFSTLGIEPAQELKETLAQLSIAIPKGTRNLPKVGFKPATSAFT